MESSSGYVTCDESISLVAKGMCVGVVMCFENFLDSISNTVDFG